MSSTMAKDSPVGVTYQELIDHDGDGAGSSLRWRGATDSDVAEIPVEQYRSRHYHELEKERLWARVWQWACREEQLANVGDAFVYEIAGKSIVLVRVSECGSDCIRGYYNVCPHRGRRLVDGDGSLSEIRCAFHGFAWTLEGELKNIPSAWDFPAVTACPQHFSLPTVRVETWAGFVFLNMDSDCEPLASFLGELPRHFASWTLEDRFVEVHVGKKVKANWKIIQEAFMESFHVGSTHPQTVFSFGDVNSQYDIFENFNRGITAKGIASPLLKERPSEQDVADSISDRRLDEAITMPVEAGQTARQVNADRVRSSYRKRIGDRVDRFTTAEIIDSTFYSVFPNFHPWGGLSRIAFRFRPNGDCHTESLMETFLLSPFQGPRPPPARPVWLRDDQPWSSVPALGSLGQIIEQDMFNSEAAQQALGSMTRPNFFLSEYQELKIRHFHKLLQRWIGE